METITDAESRDAPAPEDQEDEEDEGAATSAEELREALSRRRDSRRQRVTTPTPLFSKKLTLEPLTFTAKTSMSPSLSKSAERRSLGAKTDEI